MGTALTGNTISSSYLGLIKTTDSAAISSSAKRLTDGAGNDSPLYLSTTRLGIGITPTDTLHVSGDFNLTGAFKDSSGDTGSAGQILSSTGSGTNWIANDVGDITSVVAGDGLTGGGTSGDVTINWESTGTTGKIPKFTSTTVVGDSIVSESSSTLLIDPTGSGSHVGNIALTLLGVSGQDEQIYIYANGSSGENASIKLIPVGAGYGHIIASGNGLRLGTSSSTDSITITASTVEITEDVQLTGTAPNIIFNDSAVTKNIAKILGNVDSAGTNGGKLEFQTVADSGSSYITALAIDDSQQVGIGTTTPSTLLNLESSSTSALLIANRTNAVDGTKNLIDFKLDASDDNSYSAGSIGVEAEGTWSSTAGTRDGSIIFRPSLNGTDTTAVTIASNGDTTFTGAITGTTADFSGVLSSSDITIDVDDTPTLNFKKASSADILGIINVSTDAGSGGKMVFQTKRNGDTALDALTIDDGQNATFAGDVGINGSLTSNIACTITGNSGYEDIMYINAAGTNINSRINLIPTGTGNGAINATANDLLFQIAGTTAGVFKGKALGVGHNTADNSATGGIHIEAASSTDQLILEATGSGTAKWYLGARSNSLYFVDVVAASTRFFLDSSGNAGLGTTSPTSVAGYSVLEINHATNGGILDLSQGDTMRGRLVATSSSFSIETSGTIPMNFFLGGSTRMTINSDGDIGIGGPSVGNRTVSIYNSGANNELEFRGSDYTNVYSYSESGFDIGTVSTAGASYLRFLTENSMAMKIDHNGMVQIGGGGVANTRLVARGSTNDSSAHAFEAANNSGASMFLIRNDGKVGIGTSPVTYQLAVYANLATYGFVFQNVSSTGYGMLMDSTDGTTSYLMANFRTKDGTTKAAIYGNGDIANVNNSYGTYSDIKLKENIKDATPKLEDICKLKVRNFDLKETKEKQIGFVAQELEEVFPSLVYETDDTQDKEDGSIEKTGEKTKAIKSSVLVPMLVKAVQEQQEIINDLKTRIETLEK